MKHHDDPTTPDLIRKRATYEALRTLLVGLLVLIVLASLVVLLWEAQQIRRQGRQAQQQRAELVAQGEQIQHVLAGLQMNETNRAHAVRQIVRAQQHALALHDRATQDYLRRNLHLISVEVYNPANKEQHGLVSRTTTVYIAPKPAGFIGPVAPQPPPCHRLPNGHCRK